MIESERKIRHIAKKKAEVRAIKRMVDIVPVSQWDRGILRDIANDRGYRTDEAVTYAISKELMVHMSTAKKLLRTGCFTWGQALVVGALFEMTPKEFADCFMSGYFKEVREGEFRAVVGDPSALIQTTNINMIDKGR